MGGIEYPWGAAMVTSSAINLGTASPNIGSSTASRAVWPVSMQSTETIILAINLRQRTSRRSWWDGLASLASARIVLSFTILSLSDRSGSPTNRALYSGESLRTTPGSITSLEEKITPPIVLRSRSEEHTSELQSLMRTSYAVFCLKKKNINKNNRD